MHHECAIVAVICDAILFDDILQSKYVCDCTLVVPHVGVVTIHLSFLSDIHGSAVALKPKAFL